MRRRTRNRNSSLAEMEALTKLIQGLKDSPVSLHAAYDCPPVPSSSVLGEDHERGRLEHPRRILEQINARHIGELTPEVPTVSLDLPLDVRLRISVHLDLFPSTNPQKKKV